MNLNKTELAELNLLLSDKELDLPSFRRVVSETGANFSWLQRNIGVRNKSIPDRLALLLGFKLTSKF